MGCKSNPKDADMQKESSQREDIVTDCESRTSHSTGQDRSPQSNTVPNSNISSGPQNTLAVPTTPVRPAHQHMHHSSTDPHLHGSRPHSAHLHHRLMGRILRGMGDSYCYSCGIALRQMGDELSGEYEVRRALSTGDLPNSIKNSWQSYVPVFYWVIILHHSWYPAPHPNNEDVIPTSTWFTGSPMPN